MASLHRCLRSSVTSLLRHQSPSLLRSPRAFASPLQPRCPALARPLHSLHSVPRRVKMHDITMQSLDTADGSSASRFPEQTGDFKRMADVKLEFADVRIVKWCSQSTGLKVVWADVEGVCRTTKRQQATFRTCRHRSSLRPSAASCTDHRAIWSGPLVQGYFSVITEIFDDSGRPHTLVSSNGALIG